MNQEYKYTGCEKEFAENWEKLIDDAIKKWFEINDFDYSRLKVNPRLLRKACERVHMRKVYYDIFHNDMKISEYKHCALTAYWIVKLKPFWIEIDFEKDSFDKMEVYSYINEYIAIGMLVGVLGRFNEDALKIGIDLLSQYIKEILYSVQYRDLGKESFILLIDPFYYMYQHKSLISEDLSVIL